MRKENTFLTRSIPFAWMPAVYQDADQNYTGSQVRDTTWTDADGNDFSLGKIGPLEQFCQVMAILIDEVKQFTDGFTQIFDPETCPVSLMPFLAANVGARWNEDVPEQYAREELRNIAYLYKYKGTLLGIKKFVEVVTGGWTCEVREMRYMVQQVHGGRYAAGYYRTAPALGAYTLADGRLGYGPVTPDGLYTPHKTDISGDRAKLSYLTGVLHTIPLNEPQDELRFVNYKWYQYLYNSDDSRVNGEQFGMPDDVTDELPTELTSPPHTVDGFTKTFTTHYIYRPRTLSVEVNTGGGWVAATNFLENEDHNTYTFHSCPVAGTLVRHTYKVELGNRSGWTDAMLFEDKLERLYDTSSRYTDLGLAVLVHIPLDEYDEDYGDISLVEAKLEKLDKMLPKYVGGGMLIDILSQDEYTTDMEIEISEEVTVT